MASQAVKNPLKLAREALASRAELEAVLVKLGAKGRVNAEKHLAALEALGNPAHATLWKRMVCTLMTLAPHAVKINREENLQFYIADGKYRMQMFAIEDLRAGDLTVYCTDAVDKATEAGLLKKAADTGDEVNRYEVGSGGETLVIDRLDGKSLNPAPFFKDMMGWNRKALKIVLPVTASEKQIEAVELVCALSIQGVKAAPLVQTAYNKGH